ILREQALGRMSRIRLHARHPLFRLSSGHEKLPAYPLRVRVPFFSFVRTAFAADSSRLAALRCFALDRACFESDSCDTADCPSRFRAFDVACDRVREGFSSWPLSPFSVSRSACFMVFSDPLFGGGSFTPARRALDRPIAIACLAERAPCLPSFTCSISSWTNSPAWVDGDFPSRSSSRAFSIISFSGIQPPGDMMQL